MILMISRTKHPVGYWAFAVCLLFSSCIYEAPITEKPTRKVDEKLIGTWIGKSEKNDETVKMKVVKLDDSTYIVDFDNHLYRAWHSDVAGMPFFSVQDLEENEKQFSYSSWKLNDDGRLVGRSVSDKLVPDEAKTSKEVQQLLEKNSKNPALFNEPMTFMREKSP